MKLDAFDERLGETLRDWNLLRHPFYERWIAGTLSWAELRDYAVQYAHVVAAIPTWLERTAQLHSEHADELKEHAREESEHVQLWNQFVQALGVSRQDANCGGPNGATARLLSGGHAAVDGGEGAAVVWALEAQSPAVSAEKLRGLAAHYHIHENSGAQYFALHAELDKDHERQLRDLMMHEEAGRLGTVAKVADDTARALWDLLTSVHHPQSSI